MIWLSPVMASFFPYAPFRCCWHAESSKCWSLCLYMGSLRYHLPVLRSIRWSNRAGRGSWPATWASLEVPSHPPMSNLNVPCGDAPSPLLSSDLLEMLGTLMLLCRWDTTSPSCRIPGNCANFYARRCDCCPGSRGGGGTTKLRSRTPSSLDRAMSHG